MICNAAHPNLTDVRCRLELGPNARTDDVITFDEDGNETSRVPGQEVHVHSGRSGDGGTHRWEDAPPA
jgi:hypothetical protein